MPFQNFYTKYKPKIVLKNMCKNYGLLGALGPYCKTAQDIEQWFWMLVLNLFPISAHLTWDFPPPLQGTCGGGKTDLLQRLGGPENGNS